MHTLQRVHRYWKERVRAFLSAASRPRRTRVIDMEEPAEHRHFWVQAPVPALDVDGLAVVTVGTFIFGVVSVVMALSYEWLAAHGHTSWLQISLAGFVLGLIGLAYCWNRRRRRRRAGPD
jgi:hypothetical protein